MLDRRSPSPITKVCHGAVNLRVFVGGIGCVKRLSIVEAGDTYKILYMADDELMKGMSQISIDDNIENRGDEDNVN